MSIKFLFVGVLEYVPYIGSYILYKFRNFEFLEGGHSKVLIPCKSDSGTFLLI